MVQLQHIKRAGYTIDLFVPNSNAIRMRYQQKGPFPHWSKLWPASLAMSDFIFQHPELVQGKHVLELAAGLGLPSLMAARYAKTVCCSDYLEEAVDTMEKSVKHLQLSNVTCRVLDWNHLPEDITTEVLLLSDVNYDPEQFDRLYEVLQKFLQQKTIILLSTPQRLMAKPFIERLLPFCKKQYEMIIDHTSISLLLFKNEEAPASKSAF